MIDRSAIRSFDSFEAADLADRHERWKLAPEARLAILEQLRSYQYPDGKTAPRLQRIFNTAEFPQS